MLFTNPSIPIDQLPRAAALEMKPVDPRYLRVLLIYRVLTWFAVLAAGIAAIYFFPKWRQEWIMITGGVTWLLFAILGFWLTILSFRYKAYALREHDVIYRSGWLMQSVRVCPFNRIQHCSVDSGVIERRYGLSSLSVYTAGGAEADMKLPGLPKDVAENMRDFILSKTNNEQRA